MSTKKRTFASLPAFALAALLASCGGGGGDEGHEHDEAAEETASPLPHLHGDTEPTEYSSSCEPVPHAATELETLNRFWSTNVSLCMADGRSNAYAIRSRNSVYVDQGWLDAVARRFGPIAATGILAHEWGHIVQGYVQSGTAAELQADCLAGVHLSWARVSPSAMDQFVTSSFYAGDPYFTLTGHGTGDQRVRAVVRGYRMFASGQSYQYLVSQVCPYTPYY